MLKTKQNLKLDPNLLFDDTTVLVGNLEKLIEVVLPPVIVPLFKLVLAREENSC